MPGEEKSSSLKTCDRIEAFKDWYMSRNTLTEKTWQRHWQRIFNQLQPNKELSEGEILKVVLQTPANSRSRKLCCQKLQKLADWAGIEVDCQPKLMASHSPSHK